jgi:carbon-monoxide dehydrogenase catalytic subunit
MSENHEHTHVHSRIYVHQHQPQKNFPSVTDVLALTPDPAVKQMINHLHDISQDTLFDRFDKQKPHCTFGLSGVCCKNCNMGPCRITPKAPLGVCGANADLIVARNTLRAVAAGVAAHGARGREVMLTLKAAATGKVDLPIVGETKVIAAAKTLKIYDENKTIEELANGIADILLEDLSRALPDNHKCLHAFAPPERISVWSSLNILPIGAYHEVFESFHRTGTGTDGTWESVMQQILRTGLAFAWTSVFGSALAMDCLYGLPKRNKIEVNLGALKEEYVNIAFHGHSPVVVSAIVEASKKPKFVEQAKALGTKGIRLYGICCSGLSAQYRQGEVYPLSNALGAELVIATGLLDLWVADMQDVFPSIPTLASCFHTKVVTTSDSCHLHGAEHLGFDHHHSNIAEIHQMADQIMQRAIDNYPRRATSKRCTIPDYKVQADIGFSTETLISSFGGIEKLRDILISGKIKGIVNLVGCNNPKVIYEKAIKDVADVLLQNNILLLTNGCASFPLMKLGYCNHNAIDRCGSTLQEVLQNNPNELPPVIHFGECLDNARASALFRGLSDSSGKAIKELPIAFASPEWSNEKGLGAALSFRLLGLNSYHCIEAPISGSKNVSEFFYAGTESILGSVMVVEQDSIKLGNQIVSDINKRRQKLGWN